MKYILSFIATVVIFAGIVGGYFYPIIPITFGAASPAATTFGEQKAPAITISLTNATSTSLYNSDAFDRYVTQLQYQCTGVGSSNTAYTGAGLASVTIKGATTSVSNVGNTSTSNTAVSNTNLVFSGTLATSSVTTLVASSTLVIGGTSLNADWPAGTYLTFFTNATNTAVCTMGVQYIGS